MSKQLKYYGYVPKKQYHGFINPRQPLPIPLRASIRSLVRVLKGTTPFVRLEDATRYTGQVAQSRTWMLVVSAYDPTVKATIDTASEIQLDDFETAIENGNVIKLTIQGSLGGVDSLDSPFDDNDELRPLKPVGERQNYDLVLEILPMPVAHTDDATDALLPTSLVAHTDDATDALEAMGDLTVEFVGVTGFTELADAEGAYWYKEYGTAIDMVINVLNMFAGDSTTIEVSKGVDVFESLIANPDGDAYWGNASDVLGDPIALTSAFTYGGVLNEVDVLVVSAEDPNQRSEYHLRVAIQYPLNVEIYLPKLATAQTTLIQGDPINPITITYDGVPVVVNMTDTDPAIVGPEIEAAINGNGSIQVTASFNAGTNVITFTEKRYNGNAGGSVSIDTTGSTANFSGEILVMQGGEAFLTDEPDSEVLPTSTVTDADGEVIEATYDFKNFIYIKTDRQTLSNVNVEYSLDNITWNNAEYTIVTVGGWDYVKVLIPTYDSLFYLRLFDITISAYSRIILYQAQWFTRQSVEDGVQIIMNPSGITFSFFPFEPSYAQMTFKYEHYNIFP